MTTPSNDDTRDFGPYGKTLVEGRRADMDVYVVSDLHLAAGKNASGNYTGTENFFADQAFARFLYHVLDFKEKKKSLLIINGDFIDFLRIRNCPIEEQDFLLWQESLHTVGISKTIPELKSSISKREMEYGLKTHNFKSVWKLLRCSKGHPEVFKCLRSWLEKGNELLVIKGNHDLEWYWKAVRDFLCSLMPADKRDMIFFADDSVVINDRIYLEHGHRYENITWAEGGPTVNKGEELNLSFGAFFNRYLLNEIELVYPNLDNIRPSTNLLPLLLRERFPLAIKVLFKYIPFTIKIIPKKQYMHALRNALTFFLLIILPLGITLTAFYFGLRDVGWSGFKKMQNQTGFIFSQVKNLAFLILSYFLGRLMAGLQLAPPGSLYPKVDGIKLEHPSIKIVTFGHTHDPERKTHSDPYYFNTGTWIPVYELDVANVRLDKSYSFLSFHMSLDREVENCALNRWNDDASRIDSMLLVDRV